MPAVPLQSEYGPTLGELLAPRWRRASRVSRALVLAIGLLVVAVFVGALAKFEHPTYSYQGAVSFSFHYEGLHRASPKPGEYVLVRRVQSGQLEDSFAVGPLLVPPYSGRPSAALALYATGYIQRLAQRYAHFSLRGEGWTQVDSISPYAVYNVFYTAVVQHRAMYGRDVLLLRERFDQRRGVAISMLSALAANRQVSSPLLIGTKGALEAPLASFALE